MCSTSLSVRVVRFAGMATARDAVGEHRRRDAAAGELEEPTAIDGTHKHHQPGIHGQHPCAALLWTVPAVTGATTPVDAGGILGRVRDGVNAPGNALTTRLEQSYAQRSRVRCLG